tara:strand:+ start:1542 stop:1847 length:306 start_codon:yes stop_codon:yes gene_type:complete
MTIKIKSEERHVSDNTTLQKGDIAYSSTFPHSVKVASENNQSWATIEPIRPVTQFTPNSDNQGGLVGTMCFDNNFLYIKTASGWKRLALSDMPFTSPAVPT